jgi:hypothetical protein
MFRVWMLRHQTLRGSRLSLNQRQRFDLGGAAGLQVTANTRGQFVVFDDQRHLRVGWFHAPATGTHIFIRRDPRRQFVFHVTPGEAGKCSCCAVC